MESIFRPESLNLLRYAIAGLILAVAVVIVPFAVTFVLSYVVSLLCRCRNVRLASNRAKLVTKVAIFNAAMALMGGVIFPYAGLLRGYHFAMIGVGLTCLVLLYCLYTLPREVRVMC